MSILSVALDSGKNSTWLTLPATTAELNKALLDMGVSDKSYSIGDYRTTLSVPHEFMRDMIIGSNINVANYLAAKLADLPPVQIAKLEAVMDSPQRLTSIAQLIDFADNTDCFIFTPGIGSTEELGRYVLHESGEVDMTEEWKSGIDPEAFGKRIIEVEKGVFTSRGYLQPSGDEWNKIFEKTAAIPPEYRIENYMATAEMNAEQNYNQIDAAINNEPPRRVDLTDGQTHDEISELAPETLPPKDKPSILEQLKEATEEAASTGPAPMKKPQDIDL